MPAKSITHNQEQVSVSKRREKPTKSRTGPSQSISQRYSKSAALQYFADSKEHPLPRTGPEQGVRDLLAVAEPPDHWRSPCRAGGAPAAHWQSPDRAGGAPAGLAAVRRRSGEAVVELAELWWLCTIFDVRNPRFRQL
jgi:hypothetical protein